MVPKRFEVYSINLNPTKGSEINKIRPCIIVSPNEINNNLKTVIIAPSTHTKKNYPSRITTVFNKTSGQVCLDQIRTVDIERLDRKLGVLDPKFHKSICNTLVEMFSL